MDLMERTHEGFSQNDKLFSPNFHRNLRNFHSAIARTPSQVSLDVCGLLYLVLAGEGWHIFGKEVRSLGQGDAQVLPHLGDGVAQLTLPAQGRHSWSAASSCKSVLLTGWTTVWASK
eukprot:g21628.t1